MRTIHMKSPLGRLLHGAAFALASLLAVAAHAASPASPGRAST